MGKLSYLDQADRSILGILSTYGCLNLLELWYELGEHDPPLERMTQQEVLRRLESLKELGFVELVTEEQGGVWRGVSR